MPRTRLNQSCGKCGRTNGAEAIVCAHCGAVIAAYATPSTPPVGPATPSPRDNQDVPPPAPEAAPPPLQTSDWRDLFVRPVSTPPEPEPAALPPPPMPQGRQDQAPPKRSPEIEDSNLPASVAAMRRRAERLPSAPLPRIPEQKPAASANTFTSVNNPTIVKAPKLALSGVAMMVLACALFSVTAMFSLSDGAAGFAIACLFPIGAIMLVLGIAMRQVRSRKGNQRG